MSDHEAPPMTDDTPKKLFHGDDRAGEAGYQG